jgi:hypothetical protein
MTNGDKVESIIQSLRKMGYIVRDGIMPGDFVVMLRTGSGFTCSIAISRYDIIYNDFIIEEIVGCLNGYIIKNC